MQFVDWGATYHSLTKDLPNPVISFLEVELDLVHRLVLVARTQFPSDMVIHVGMDITFIKLSKVLLIRNTSVLKM